MWTYKDNRNNMSHEIEQIVDDLLFERSRYEPLLLLQHTGNLKYRHYDAWRSGKTTSKNECLDAALLGELGDILTALKRAAIYAEKLGLESTTVSYTGWGDAAGLSLCLSRDSRMQIYLSTHYQPSQGRIQMDLFMDSPITGVLNSISKALSQRNPDEAEKQLQQLEEMDASHTQIKTFYLLLEAQKHLHEPITNIRDELEKLEQSIAPLAKDTLKQEARDFLAPHWWKLSEALHDSTFNPDIPTLHCSYTYAHTYDWNGVRASIEWEEDWHQQPVLLIRHVKACTMLHDELASYLSVFRLCWHHPTFLDKVFDGEASAGLKQQWRTFQDSLFHDTDEPLDREDFPAWFLMMHPGLMNSLPSQVANEEGNEEGNEGKGYRSYQLVHSLLQHHQQQQEDDEMQLRQQLQTINPELFNCFIQHRQTTLRS